MISKERLANLAKPSSSLKIWGWVELLFYFGAEDRLKSLEHIRPRDYMRWERTLPAAEFYGPYDVYETTLEKMESPAAADMDPAGHAHRFGLPRPLAQYDIINVHLKDRDTGKVRVDSVLLVEEQHNLHLLYPRVKLQIRPGRALAGLPLRKPILK